MVIKVQEIHILAYAKYEWEERTYASRIDAIKQGRLRAAEADANQHSDLATPPEEPASSASSFSTHWLFNRLLNQVSRIII